MTADHQPTDLPQQATTPGHRPVPGATGATGWWAFFASYIPIPVLNFAVWIWLAWSEHKKLRGQGTSAAENARNAVNWALTYIVGYAAIVLVMAVLAIGAMLLAGSGAVDEESVGLFGLLLLIPFLALFAWTVLAWVHAIRGGLRAAKGVPHRAAPTIPFVKS